MKLFKVFLFSIVAMFVFSFMANAISPTENQGYNIEQSYDCIQNVATTVNDFADSGNMVLQMYNTKSEDVPLYSKLSNIYIETKGNYTGQLYLSEKVSSPLLLRYWLNNWQKQNATLTNKNYIEIGYSLKK